MLQISPLGENSPRRCYTNARYFADRVGYFSLFANFPLFEGPESFDGGPRVLDVVIIAESAPSVLPVLLSSVFDCQKPFTTILCGLLMVVTVGCPRESSLG